jgi:hypothetical protein
MTPALAYHSGFSPEKRSGFTLILAVRDKTQITSR